MKISKGAVVRALLLVLALINQALQSSGHQVIPVDSTAVADLVSWLFTAAATVAGFWKNNSFTVAGMFGDKQMRLHKALAALAKIGVITTADTEALLMAVANANQSALVTEIKSTVTDNTKTNSEKAADITMDVGAAILNAIDYGTGAASGSAETKAGIEADTKTEIV